MTSPETPYWPPVRVGQRVYTKGRQGTEEQERLNWAPEAVKNRKWGVTGKVVQHHDSHGLCYDVLHDDGTSGCYDPEELDLLEPVIPMPALEKVYVYVDDNVDTDIGFVIEVYASEYLVMKRLLREIEEYVNPKDVGSLFQDLKKRFEKRRRCVWGTVRVAEADPLYALVVDGTVSDHKCEWVGGCQDHETKLYRGFWMCPDHLDKVAKGEGPP